jgi:hypothetical protein
VDLVHGARGTGRSCQAASVRQNVPY